MELQLRLQWPPFRQNTLNYLRKQLYSHWFDKSSMRIRKSFWTVTSVDTGYAYDPMVVWSSPSGFLTRVPGAIYCLESWRNKWTNDLSQYLWCWFNPTQKRRRKTASFAARHLFVLFFLLHSQFSITLGKWSFSQKEEWKKKKNKWSQFWKQS